MATTYYKTDLTKEQIDQALHAVNGVASSQNNGKVLYIDQNGEIKAKSAAEWQMHLVPKTITQNGSYDPASDGADGYNGVSVNVPNSYAAADEGKVVSNGALVAQTARTPAIEENGTYDTTGNNSVTVNVPSGAAPVLQPKTVTENGDYYPPTGVDGFSELHVNVQGGGGSGGALVTPAYQGLAYCYVTSDGSSFYQDINKNQYIQFYEVQANHIYALFVGFNVGTRRRASFFHGKTFSDFEPYIDTQPQSQTLIFSSGECLAPFVSGTDDTGNALAGRIMTLASQNGVIVYGTGSNGGNYPAYCVDFGEHTIQGVIAYHIYTKSTSGSDAAIYVVKGEYDISTSIFAPIESPVPVVYTSVQQSSSFYNIGAIATLDYHSGWQVYATAAITDGTDNYAAGERVKQWTYNTSVDFVIYKSQ